MVRIRLIITAIVIMGALAVPGSPAHATGWQVTKTADTMDFVCDADCSLREALYAANNTQGLDSIDIPGGGAVYYLTISGTGEEFGLTGDLDITDEVQVFGDENPIIEINGPQMNDRVIQVTGPWSVLISGVTIRGGQTAGEGGGIYSQGYVSLYNTTVSGNDAANSGGGISVNGGSLSMANSTVSNNSATGYGGGIYNYSGTITLNETTVTGNEATTGFYLGAGGGISSYVGSLTLNNTAVSNNSTTGSGGGMLLTEATVTLNDSTVSGNTAVMTGGGMLTSGVNLNLVRSSIFANFAANGGGLYSGINPSTATVVNSTISGNTATGVGGGVYNYDGSLTLASTTVSGNGAATGGGLYNGAGQTLVSRNSIVANSLSGGNCAGAISSSGFNLSSDASCAFSNFGDMNGTNPLLGPLAYSGGITPTHAFLDGSPAADAAGPSCPATDQRGTSRPQGLRCDIGAFEAPDSDADGVSDPLDADDDNDGFADGSENPGCRTLAEDYDAFDDWDGCPDSDNDGDGICDAGQTSVSCAGSDSGKRCFDPAATLSCPTTDCRNLAEDMDAFKDGDGCPEPDNDNDGKLDAADVCPGTDSLAGANGMLGSPQDLNHNGVRDAGAPWNEAVLTTDDSPLALAFEDYDGVLDADGCHDSPGADFDGDGLTDDNEVFTHLTDAGNPDTDADTVIDGADNCPNWPNTPQTLPAWTIPALDSDCDGFTVAREQWTGTDPTRHCNADSAANNEAIDAWPSDFNDSRLTSLADVVLMGPVYNQSTGTDPAKKRFDLNASGVVSLADVVLMGPFYNKSCA